MKCITNKLETNNLDFADELGLKMSEMRLIEHEGVEYISIMLQS